MVSIVFIFQISLPVYLLTIKGKSSIGRKLSTDTGGLRKKHRAAIRAKRNNFTVGRQWE